MDADGVKANVRALKINCVDFEEGLIGTFVGVMGWLVVGWLRLFVWLVGWLVGGFRGFYGLV